MIGPLIVGVAFDFQTHHGDISFAEEGFLTHSHVLIYAMALGLARVVGYTARNRRLGGGWRQAIAPGYRWGLLALGLVGLALTSAILPTAAATHTRPTV